MVRRLAALTRGRFGLINAAAASLGAGALIVSAAVAGCGGSDTATGAGASPASVAPVALGSGPAAALQQQYEDVIKAVLPSVVQINTSDETGSGVVYDDKGDIVTNAHVVGSASTVQVMSDASGATLTAKVLGVFAADDLAVIRVTSGAGSLHPATWGRSEGVAAGQLVLAVGSPLGLTGSATQGIISATGRTVIEAGLSGTATTTIADALQTSAAINSGNSGGALVTLTGQVIGIPTAAARDSGTANAPGIGFAIPSDTVTSIAGQLISAGKVTQPGRATLGISARTAVTASGQPSGVAIASLSDGGPADSAGLRAGDVITSVDGSETRSEAQLAALLASLQPGMQVNVTYTQSGFARTAKVTLGSSWS
jgi:S1-C subfamily serine protease